MAGTVEKIGANISGYSVGDRVFGDLSDSGFGGYSQYCCVKETQVAPLDKTISFEIAAATPLAAGTALQGMRDIAKLQPGMSVLINGASGGVGSMAIAMAKSMGAEVTAVCSTEKIHAIESLRPDHIINYSTSAIEDWPGNYDVIFDCAMYRPISDYNHLLKDQGMYIGNGGNVKYVLRLMAGSKFMWLRYGKTYTSYLARYHQEDLTVINDLLVNGQLKPYICKTFDLEQIQEAMSFYESRASSGKIIIKCH